MGTLEIELLIGPTTLVTLFQVLRIPTSFNLFFSRPQIHKARAIPSSLHQKVKFIHDGQVVTVQFVGDMFISSEPMLRISHSDDDLFFTGFTFDEVQTLEMEDFCRDFVAMLFDQHDSMVVLDMMRSMSYLPSMGFGQRQHGPNEFMAIPNHDVLFELGFIPTEADYRYMARMREKMMRARLTHTPFNYLVHLYTMSLVDYFVRASEPQEPSDGIIEELSTIQEAELQRLVHQLQLSDGDPSTLTSTLVALSSPNRMSLMMLYFPDEIYEHRTFAEIGNIVDEVVPHDEYIDEMLTMSMSQIKEIVQSELASPFDLFKVSVIEIAKEIQTAPAPGFTEDVIVVDGLFDGPIDPVEGASDFVDLPFSFVSSRFVSCSDNVHDFSFMDLNIFQYLLVSCDITLSTPSSPTSQIFDIDDEIAQHDSDDDSSSASDLDPIDKKVSPVVGDRDC